MKSRVKTSLRKAANSFHIIGNTIISHETVRRYIPFPTTHIMESSGYFVYDGNIFTSMVKTDTVHY